MSFKNLHVLQHRRKATLIKTFLASKKGSARKKHEFCGLSVNHWREDRFHLFKLPLEPRFVPA